VAITSEVCDQLRRGVFSADEDYGVSDNIDIKSKGLGLRASESQQIPYRAAASNNIHRLQLKLWFHGFQGAESWLERIQGVSSRVDISEDISTVWLQFSIFYWRGPCRRGTYIVRWVSEGGSSWVRRDSRTVEKADASADTDTDAETVLTWHKNNGGFPLKPVVGGNIIHVLNCGSILLYQHGPAANAVNRWTERRGRRSFGSASASRSQVPSKVRTPGASAPEPSRRSAAGGHSEIAGEGKGEVELKLTMAVELKATQPYAYAQFLSAIP
jgi:hypothetical protein